MPRRLLSPLLAVALIGCSSQKGSAGARAADASTLQHAATAARPATAGDSVAALLAKADAGRIIGNAGANVWLIIVSDFQCPYCKNWHDETWDALRKEYVETGKIRVAYVNLPLSMHRNALPAAQAAMCAAVQGKFWPMQDALFRTQQEWKGAVDPAPAFEALAREAGANADSLRACVTSGAMRPLIQGDEDRATKAGAQSTPTFFVGGKPVIGAQPLAAFREALDAALSAKPSGK